MTPLNPILLVEDDFRDRELVEAVLSKCGVANSIVMAGDGVEALDYVYRRGRFADETLLDPAVILLDLKMPKIDGLEVVALLKADPSTRHIPIVMLTSSREERDIVESYKSGVNAYVVKPMLFEEFTQAIQSLASFWTVLNELPPGTVTLLPAEGTS